MTVTVPRGFRRNRGESSAEKGVDKPERLCYNTQALKECALNIAE